MLLSAILAFLVGAVVAVPIVWVRGRRRPSFGTVYVRGDGAVTLLLASSRPTVEAREALGDALLVADDQATMTLSECLVIAGWRPPGLHEPPGEPILSPLTRNKPAAG